MSFVLNMEDKLRDLAKKARKNRLNEQPRIIGYCYENAEEMSYQLYKNNINHKLYYVGIINDVIQNCIADFEECVKANKNNTYEENVPETINQLPDAANHYTIVVKSNNAKLVVEPCSELRDEHFRDIYVGEWPNKDYLELKDSKISKESKFDHYK